MAARTARREQILGAIPAKTLATLLNCPDASRWIVDLGCGEGSFDYRAFPKARIVAVDRTATGGVTSPGALGIVADLARLPLKGGACELVVLNHVLERTPGPVGVLREARRLLSDRGFLYISIPDGFGFDDWLYRSLYGLCGYGPAGHGHINRFSFESLVQLTAAIGFEVVYYCDWLSAFTYLPTHPKWKRLGGLQKPLIALTRYADRFLHTNLSRYGWMLLLQKQSSGAQSGIGSPVHDGSALGGYVEDDGRLNDDAGRSVPWRPGVSVPVRLYRSTVTPLRAMGARLLNRCRMARRRMRALAEPIEQRSDRRRYLVGKRFYSAVHRHLSGLRQYPDHYPMYPVWLEFALSTNLRGRRVAQQLQQYTRIRGARYLDVGCAYGGYPIAFAGLGAEAVGIDIDEGLLSLADENAKDQRLPVVLLQRDVTKAEQLHDLGRFDILTCNDLIEHVADVPATFRNLSVLLRPNGLLYMEIPNARSVGQVLKDGHYGLFGISLLPRRDAVRYYLESGRMDEYAVGYYHRLAEYETFLAENGIRLHEGDVIGDDDLADRVEHVRSVLPPIRTALEQRLREPGLSPESQRALHCEVSAYLIEAEAALARCEQVRGTDLWRMTSRELVRDYAIEFWQLIGVKQDEGAATCSGRGRDQADPNCPA